LHDRTEAYRREAGKNPGKDQRDKGGDTMGMIKWDEIRGIWISSGQLVCFGCATGEEEDEATEDEFLTDVDLNGEDLYFCDRCKEKIEGGG